MKLKEYRKRYNLTQAEVGKIINKTGTGYGYYESGKNEPDIQSLLKLADYYHTTIDDLLGHEVPFLINKSEFSSNQLIIIDKIKKLDNEQCKMLLSYIDGLHDGKFNNLK